MQQKDGHLRAYDTRVVVNPVDKHYTTRRDYFIRIYHAAKSEGLTLVLHTILEQCLINEQREEMRVCHGFTRRR